MVQYGIDPGDMDAFSAEMNAMLEEMWKTYGPEGEDRESLIAWIKGLWSTLGAMGEDGVGKWISSLFTAQSTPISNSAPVVAVAASNSRVSRLSSAAGIQSNDYDASVTVVTKNEVCLAFVIGENQTRKGVDGVIVRLRDATKPDAPLAQYTSKDGGLVILPSNLFVSNKYDEVHLYVDVDPRTQGYRNYVIEDLDLKLGGTYMDTLVPLEDAASNGSAASNASKEPYIVTGSFNGKDIMHSDYEMIYSPANSKKFTIKAVVANPSGKDLPDLMMSWYENEGGFKRIQKHWAEATTKKTTAEGYVEYTFKGAWKQKFSPNASDEQRPTFSFGKADGALSIPTRLVALRSATDEPLNEGTGAEGGVYANVLGKGFSMGFNIPVVDVNVGLELPFTKYWPRLSIDPAGFVAMWVGCPIMEEELEESSLNWESEDMKEFRRASEFVQQEGWYANYKAQFGLASDFYREKKWKFMGQSSIEIGMFAVGTGRWELDNNNEDVKSKNIQVALGFGLTACYEYSWTISYPVGPVPVYICFTLGVYAGVSIQFTADFCFIDGGFANFKIYPIDEITYSISFNFAAQLGIGIKGFLEAYVLFIASLDVMIRFVLFGLDKCSTQVSAGFELSTSVTVFFVKFRKSWLSKEKIIFSTVPADNSLLDHYMNAEKNDEKVVEAAHLDPQGYPDLSPEATTIVTSKDANASFKVVHVNNADFVFYITNALDKNGNKHRRVNWVNAKDTMKGGTDQEAIDAWQSSLNGYDDYAFDAYLKLMGTGTSYFSIVPNEVPSYKENFPSPMSICSIPELLKPVVNLTAAITQAPAIAAGNFEDISLALMNAGNMGVSTFDVALYEVNDGKEGKKPIETVHVNCVDPEKSKITMQGGKVELTGKKVAHCAEDFDYTARQRDWVLSQEKKEYKVVALGTYNYVESVKTMDSGTQYVTSEVLMPGSIGVYNTAFKIPESWRGEKTLRFKLTQLSVRSNLTRLASNANGADLLTSTLDESTGKLMLQKPAQANGIAANAIQTSLFANAVNGSTLDLVLSVHDLSASHRVYTGWDGQKWLDITVHDFAAFGDNTKLACAVYVDGASEPYYVNLPYYEDAIADRTTQTISMPLSALVDDPSAHDRARVEVTVVGREDCAFSNNEFTVYLGGSGLHFIQEPEDAIVQEGEDVDFTVEVGGGVKPYTYQWQVWDEKHQKWVDLPDFTDPVLRRENIEKSGTAADSGAS